MTDAVSGGYEPPDVQVASGAGWVVETVNLAERSWRTDRTPAQHIQTRDLAELFGSADDQLTDPRILFDAASGRWLASVSDVDADAVLLATSLGPDPTGAFTVSRLPAAGCPDQPRLGIADATLVVAAAIYTDCERAGAPTLGDELWTVSKADLLAGSTSPAVATYGPVSGYTSLTPVRSLTPTSTQYVVSVDDRVSRVVHLLTVDGVPPEPVQVREVAAPDVRLLARPPLAPQPPVGGQSPPISTNDIRVLDALWEDGRLWISANNRCTPPGDIIIRTCARVVELSTESRSVLWDVDLSIPGAHVFYPALSTDGNGNLVVVAGESGVSVMPQLVAFGRTADGAVSPPAVIAKSAGAYRGDRYGDYFGAAVDPTRPGVVWVAGEVGTDSPSGDGWSTTLASIVVTPAGETPPAVAGVTPPAVRATRSVVRAGGSVRLAYRALADGDDVRAVVVVRDAQNAVVYRTTTPSGSIRSQQLYDVLWPALKAAGRFTFCVSSRSSAGTESAPSCARITVSRAAR